MRQVVEHRVEGRRYPGARAVGVSTLAVSLALVSASVARAQTAAHAPSGEFKPPTPSQQHRQDATLDNLEHPIGYRTAPLGSLGQVVRRGNGDIPVVLVAGLGFGWRVFQRLVETHEDEYRFYLVSLPGYGGSSAPPMPPAGTSYGDRTWLAGAERGLSELLDDEGLERPILGAFYSDAANVVVRFAAANPERLGGLLVMSAAPRFPIPPGEATRGERMDGFAEGWFKTVTEIMWPSGMFTPEFYSNAPDIAERAWWEVLEPSLPVAIRYTVETWADDLVPLLPDLSAPTIVLSPGFDETFMSGSNGELVRTRIQAGWDESIEAGAPIDHRIVSGARFLIWEDRPDSVADALSDLAAGR